MSFNNSGRTVVHFTGGLFSKRIRQGRQLLPRLNPSQQTKQKNERKITKSIFSVWTPCGFERYHKRKAKCDACI